MPMIDSALRRGFTLMELMIVVAILGVLSVLTLVGIQSLDNASIHALDVTNQRAIARASTQHAADHRGRLLHPRTAPVTENDLWSFVNDGAFIVESDDLPDLVDSITDRLWVRAYDEPGVERLYTVDQGQPEQQKIERPEAMSHGAAWQYMDGNLETYKSPLDTTPRARSYSLNAFVGCAQPGAVHRGLFLICADCGDAIEVEDEVVDGAIVRSAKRFGFEVQSCTIEAVGICPGCKSV